MLAHARNPRRSRIPAAPITHPTDVCSAVPAGAARRVLAPDHIALVSIRITVCQQVGPKHKAMSEEERNLKRREGAQQKRKAMSKEERNALRRGERKRKTARELEQKREREQ